MNDTIRLGSVGPSVIAWQTVIGVEPDGVFGPKTRAATILWQSARGLSADGIVGPASWAASGTVLVQPVIEGIDISIAQKDVRIDFRKLHDVGIQFVVGRGNAGEAGADSTFHSFASRTRAEGMLFSAYHYALPDASPDDDVDAFLSALGDLPLDFPAWLDLETLNGRSPAEVLDWSSGWIDRYRSKRGAVDVYSGQGFWSSLGPAGSSDLYRATFERCRLISAAYGASRPPVFGPWKRAAFHQWAANTIWRMPSGEHRWGPKKPHPDAVRIAAPGIVEGVDGEVDRDHFFGTLDELRGTV